MRGLTFCLHSFGVGASHRYCRVVAVEFRRVDSLRVDSVNLGKVFVAIPRTTMQRPNAQHPLAIGFRTPIPNTPWQTGE